LTDEQRELTQIMRSSGQSLVHLINDVLDFSKLESDKMEIEKAPVDLIELIEETIEMFSYQAAEKAIELLYYVEVGVPSLIFGDRERLKQVLVNLIGNALKFTEQGEVVVTVKRSAQQKDNGSEPVVRLAVRDTGIGIAPENADKIFEAFTQADASTTRQFGGTGLGLAISRKLCDLMGGQLKLKSHLGEGSEFYFDLRCREVPQQGKPRNEMIVEDLDRVRGKTVAILTSNQTLGSLLVLKCRQWNLVPHLAATYSPDLLRELARSQPDLLIIDPLAIGEQHNAIAVAELLNRLEVPTVFLSSIGSQTLQPVLERLPRVGQLFKPVSDLKLAEAILSSLGGVDQHSRLNQAIAEKGGTRLKSGTLADLHPARILVVEDVAMNRKISGLVLSKLGYKDVSFAENGQIGVEMVAKGDVDLVFMDLHMPVMGGLEATEQIRKNFGLPRQPVVIAMTGHAIAGVKDSCLEAGMDDFITKPITIERVEESIRECLESSVNKTELSS
ncbi:MAG: ATP-binding protein, partial [Verrucomicrobiota bacterium]